MRESNDSGLLDPLPLARDDEAIVRDTKATSKYQTQTLPGPKIPGLLSLDQTVFKQTQPLNLMIDCIAIASSEFLY